MKASEPPESDAGNERSSGPDARNNPHALAQLDTKISALEAHNTLLANHVEELKKLEGANYDLKKQLDVKSAENDILRQITSELQARLSNLESGVVQPAVMAAAATAAAQAAHFPDASTTGVPANITLKPSGPLIISQPGIYEGLAIEGDVWVNVSGVTLRHLEIRSSSYQGINCGPDTENLKIHDCSIDGQAKTIGSYGIVAPTNCEIFGNDIRGFENGIVAGSRNTIKGNFIHDLFVLGADPHYDAIALHGGQNDVLIEGNTLISWDTSGVFIKADFGDIDNVRVVGNLIKCQEGEKYSAAVYVYGQPNGKATNVLIEGNHCEIGAYGYFFSIEGTTTGLVIKDNLEYRTLNPIR